MGSLAPTLSFLLLFLPVVVSLGGCHTSNRPPLIGATLNIPGVSRRQTLLDAWSTQASRDSRR
ncbi:hypothetical protein Micbo1qcDRAFT_165117, partial [Microdochium bolleyi]